MVSTLNRPCLRVMRSKAVYSLFSMSITSSGVSTAERSVKPTICEGGKAGGGCGRVRSRQKGH